MTVDEKVVRAVAEALCRADGCVPDALDPAFGEEELWERYVDDARAAILSYLSARSAEPVASEIGEEDIARAILQEEYSSAPEDVPNLYRKALDTARLVMDLLHPALERARRGERERCAKIAEGEVVGMSCFVSKQDWAEQKGLRIAAAIRKGSGE